MAPTLPLPLAAALATGAPRPLEHLQVQQTHRMKCMGQIINRRTLVTLSEAVEM